SIPLLEILSNLTFSLSSRSFTQRLPVAVLMLKQLDAPDIEPEFMISVKNKSLSSIMNQPKQTKLQCNMKISY
ncbi:TPA: hypothetical protein ACV71D_005320, partial [Escherichia coli]